MPSPIFYNPYIDPEAINRGLKALEEHLYNVIKTINMNAIALQYQLSKPYRKTIDQLWKRNRDSIYWTKLLIRRKHLNPYFTSYIHAYALQKAIRRGNIKRAARQGKVFIENTSYKYFLDELTEFPNSHHDDKVDSLSICLDHLDHRCKCKDPMKPLKNQFHPKQNELRRK